MFWRCLVLLLLTITVQSEAFSQTPDRLPLQTRDSLLADSITRRVDSLTRTGALPQLSIPDSTRSGTADSATPIKAAIPSGKNWTLSGRILDKNTGETLPFATIAVPRSTIGEPTDLDGNFKITIINPPVDSVVVTAMGYRPWKMRLSPSRPTQVLTIEMERTENELKEVVIRPGLDPALKLMRKVVAAKPQNDPEKLDAYQCELYNKLEVDIQRLTRAQFEKLPGMKSFSFIYDNLDTVSEALPFLPFFLTESLADYYFRSDPKKTREVVKASLVKGIRNEAITQFLGGSYVKLNTYKNRIPVFDKNYVSPISDNGELYYKYKIVDTQEVRGHQVFRLQYGPKRAGENCFYGDFWIADSSFAVERISLELPKDANINWVSRMSLYQEFTPLSDTLWVVAKDKFVVEFKVPYSGKKLPGFIARKTAIYSDYVPGRAAADSGLENPAYHRDVVILDSATQATNAQWETLRPEALSKNERAIYHAADTLQTLPAFVRAKNWIRFLTTGRKEIGWLDIGPIWSFYSRNPVEGHRFRFGGSTNEKLFKDVQLEGYLAYGTRDDRFKYKASALWLLNREPRTAFYASFTHDVDRSTSYYTESNNTDNLFTNILRKGSVPWKVAFSDEARVEWRKEYYSGFSHKLIAARRDFTPYAPLPAIFQSLEGEPTNTLVTTEVGLSLRMAYKERFLNGRFRRLSLGSRYPVGELRYAHGMRGVLGGAYNYDKVSLTVNHFMRLGGLGKARATVFGGKIFGTQPYPILEIHPGNDFYSYNPRAFNMMNRYEFISDTYAGFLWEHDLGGGLFNYIPLLKKAKLRQFWTAKGVIGRLSEANEALNLQKGYPFRTLEQRPYIELGTGVENIFQFFRIDFVWRVAPAPLPFENRNRHFGVFGSIKLEF
jgi:hypothetical protein